MIIKCPKCGFQQPDDQFCANCGINLETYIPPEPSLLKKLNASTLIHIALFLGVVLIAIALIQNNDKKEIKERVRYFKTATTDKVNPNELSEENQKKNSKPTKQTTSANLERSKLKPSQGNDTNQDREGISEVKYELSATDSQTFASDQSKPQPVKQISEKPSQALVKPQKIYTQFYEASLTFISELAEESQKNDGLVTFSGEYSSGSLKNANKLISKGLKTEQLILIRKSLKAIQPDGQIEEWFEGSTSGSKQKLGLTFFIQIIGELSYPIQTEISITRHLKEDYMFPVDSYRLSRNDSVFISGTLPVDPLTNIDTNLLQNSIMKIYLSDFFQNQETTFLILFGFQ